MGMEKIRSLKRSTMSRKSILFLTGGIVVVLGTAGEFAGAYMKSGTLILNDAKGFAVRKFYIL